MSLVDFVLARLAEDEATARAALAFPPPDDPALKDFPLPFPYRVYLTRMSPQRVLADCEARRSIVELCVTSGGEGGASVEDGMARIVLRELAWVHHHHPDFDDTW